jgi:hypothetical protein
MVFLSALVMVFIRAIVTSYAMGIDCQCFREH